MSSNKNKLIAFNYFGGKFTWLEHLYGNFPTGFAHLVDVFAGSMCVSINYRGNVIRTANEINGEITNFFEALNPDYIQIENVEEFMSWGDLDAKGKPISKDAGRCYREWVDNVRGYGYTFDHRILNAADFGAYTSRKRFFGQFANEGLPTAWPEQTHAKKPTAGDLFGRQLRKWNPVRPCLDLEDEGESIFDRKKPLVEASLARVYAGCVQFVAGGKKEFLVKYNSMSQRRKYVAPGIDEPCPTVATQNRLGIATVDQVEADRFLCKHFGGSPDGKCSSVEAPAGTITTVDHHAFVSVYYGNGRSASANRPLGTITTTPKYNLVTPWIMNTNFGNVGSSLDAPAQTVTANRKWHYLMNPQFASAGASTEKPCFTLIARMDKRPPQLVTAVTEGRKLPSFIRQEGDTLVYEIYTDDTPTMVQIKEFMALYGLADIKMRMLRIPELKRIMGFPENYVLIGTQADQKKFIGNAVEVTMARVLCEATCARLIEQNITPSRVAA